MQPTLKKTYEVPPENECVFNHSKFIPDIFVHIFSYLGRSGPSIHCVCKDWSQRLVTVENDKLLLLYKLIHETKLSIQLNLEGINLRQSVNHVKDAIIIELSKVKDKESLSALETNSKKLIQHTFLDNIFQLTEGYKKLAKAKKSNSTFAITMAYDNLIELREIDLLVQMMLIEEDLKPYERFVRKVCEILACDGNIPTAMKIANLFSSTEALKEIIEALVKMNNWQKALEFAKPYNDLYRDAIRDIINNLISQDKIEIALEVLNNLVCEEDFIINFKHEAVTQLLRKNNFQKNLTSVALWPLDIDKDLAYERMIRRLLGDQEVELAFKTIDLIQDYSKKPQLISEAHFANIQKQVTLENFKTPWKSLCLLVEAEITQGYDLVATKWIDTGKLDKVLKIAKHISTSLLERIIDQLLVNDDIEKALEFGNSGLSEEGRRCVYTKITIDYIKKEEVQQGYEMALVPKDTPSKVYNLHKIGRYHLDNNEIGLFLCIPSKIANIIKNAKDNFQSCLIKDHDNFLANSASILETKYREYEKALQLFELMSPLYKKDQLQKTDRIKQKIQNKKLKS